MHESDESRHIYVERDKLILDLGTKGNITIFGAKNRPKNKMNAFVTIMLSGQRPRKVGIDGKTPLDQVLQKEGIRVETGAKISVNGKPTTAEHHVRPGDSVTIAGVIQGG